MNPSPLIVEVLRGTAVESQHVVDAVVLDADGRRVQAYGDPSRASYPRSVIKPLQALPFVLSGAWRDLPNSESALALACSSHYAEPRHLAELEKWRDQFGFHDEDFACGPQEPYDTSTAEALIREGQSPCRIHNNCSGKHLGMLSTCNSQRWPTRGYEQWDHPMQVEVRSHLTRLSGVDHDSLAWGIDGCGIPTYRLPLENVAKMFTAFHDAHLSDTTQALALLRKACAHKPLLVGGTGVLCSVVGEASRGQAFAKVGAEGNYIGLVYNEGLSIALKVRDGAFRASQAALAHLLAQHANLDEAAQAKINAVAFAPLKNWAGTIVGSIRIALPSR